MAITLLIWLYVTLLCFLYGNLLRWILERFLPGAKACAFRSLPLVILAGFFVITFLATLLAFTLPLGLTANLLLIVGGICLAVAFRKTILQQVRGAYQGLRRVGALTWLLFLTIGLVTLMKTIGLPLNYDTGLYHAQTIRWIETYAVVPGLGNLESRLAFDSLWFLPQALFSFSFSGWGSFHVLNGWLFLLVNFWLIGKTSRLLQGHFTLSNIAAPVLIFFSRRLFSLELSSPGNDLPATLLVWVVFLLAVEKIESGRSHEFDITLPFLWLLVAFTVATKLSTAPLVLIPLHFTLLNLSRLNWKRSLLCIAGAALTILPWLARNVILSGYVLFPVAWLDLFDLDWKIPARYVRQTAEDITAWARLPGRTSLVVLATPVKTWLPIWWSAQSNLTRELLGGTAAGTILISLVTVGRAVYSRFIPKMTALFFYAWIGLVYWFINAPDIRFGYGFLTVTIALWMAAILNWLLSRLKQLANPSALIIVLVLLTYQAVSLYNLRDLSKFKGYWILPASYPTIQTETRALGGFDTNMPVEGDQCWYAALPCTPDHNPEVHLRGDQLATGFCNRETCKK